MPDWTVPQKTSTKLSVAIGGGWSDNPRMSISPTQAIAVPASISAADPWAGDLFGRKAEAHLLIDYIESVGGRANMREDHAGFTIAVDADYGVGKSYFLKRLAINLTEKHPVAFVDAWSDDLADEPLTAIAATLKKALAPLISDSSQIASKWDIVAKKTGAVAKIAALGLLKKGLGVLVTGAAVEAAEGVIRELGSGLIARIAL